ncbi:HNH endonuclease [Mycobacterium rufum]|uniref:HNH endonuclease n=1 Tax=Mycolicibacterium rufum TaxID=318424 RepID=A0A9X2Y945_9MYCO|nr:HNH endonuclease [Mycolicibacterium rufum]
MSLGHRDGRTARRGDAMRTKSLGAQPKTRLGIADQIRQSVTSRPTERCRNHTGSDVPLRYRTCVLDRRRHGTPSSRCRAGGTHSMTNLQPACRPCNEAKGSSAESELKS